MADTLTENPFDISPLSTHGQPGPSYPLREKQRSEPTVVHLPPATPSNPWPVPPTSSSESSCSDGCLSDAPPSPSPNTEYKSARRRRLDASDDAYSIKLIFTRDSSSAISVTEDFVTLPPAFYQNSRVQFAPLLRVSKPVSYSAFRGMHLGVTGILETFTPSGGTTRRMIADFCTDLTNGLDIWKRDGEAAMTPEEKKEFEAGSRFLPCGTYILPLSMVIPNTALLPPSIETAHFRISYTMSLAIFSSKRPEEAKSRYHKVHSIPFQVLPSTLPTPAPHPAILVHHHGNSTRSLSSFIKSISFNSKSSVSHSIQAYLPTETFSPGARASIPVTIRLVDRFADSVDMFVRISLHQKIYVRESTSCSLVDSFHDDLGFGFGPIMDMTNEANIQPYCVQEKLIASRWAWFRNSSQPKSDSKEERELLLKDIVLPLAEIQDERGNIESWSHGYTSSLDIEPSELPNLGHGAGSWFSPAFRDQEPIGRDYERHIHVSSRFFVGIELGTVNNNSPSDGPGELEERLQNIMWELGGVFPPDGQFTPARGPVKSSNFGERSPSNPFGSSGPTRSKPGFCGSIMSNFPGRKMQEILLPIEIGSVAEPRLSCLLDRYACGQTERDERREREEYVAREDRGEMPYAGCDRWICPPPSYDEALKVAPTY